MTAPAAPDLDDMPYLSASLGGREARFRTCLDRLNEYLAAGSIPNARYDDLRGGLMDGLSQSWRAGVPEALIRISRGQDLKDVWREGSLENLAMTVRQDLDLSSYEGLAAVDRLAKRVDAQLSKDHPPEIVAALADAKPRIAEIRAVADAMGWLRERRVKRAPPGSAPPEPVLPRATMEAQKAVRTRMREVLGELREKFTQYVVERVGNQANALEENCTKLAALIAQRKAEARAEREAGRRVSFSETYDVRTLRDRVAHLHRLGQYLVDYDPNTYETKRHADGDKRALAFAKGETERVFHLWTERNVSKLAPIVEAKDGVAIEVLRARASYEGVDTIMAVTFPDTSRFSFSNAIEYSVSPLGLPFVRFPARYHDVHGADGERLKAPSEARVKEAFIPGFDPDAEDEPASGPRP